MCISSVRNDGSHGTITKGPKLHTGFPRPQDAGLADELQHYVKESNELQKGIAFEVATASFDFLFTAPGIEIISLHLPRGKEEKMHLSNLQEDNF